MNINNLFFFKCLACYNCIYSKKLDRPQSLGSSKEEMPWSSCDSSGYGTDTMAKTTRVLIPKANSFGGTGTFVLQHMKSPAHNSLSKAGMYSQLLKSGIEFEIFLFSQLFQNISTKLF